MIREADLASPGEFGPEKKGFSQVWGRFVPKVGKAKTPAPSTGPQDLGSEGKPPAPYAGDPPQRQELESKIIAQIVREFSSGDFFYSFDCDLTRTLQHKRRLLMARATSETALADLLPKNSFQSTFPPGDSPKSVSSPMEEDDFVEPNIQVPLWRRVDRRFFWNEALLKDFIGVGLHDFILPLGQIPVDLVVLSRRSQDRAGLRYQRGGIDDEGNVANMAETEMIVRAKASKQQTALM